MTREEQIIRRIMREIERETGETPDYEDVYDGYVSDNESRWDDERNGIE